MARLKRKATSRPALCPQGSASTSRMANGQTVRPRPAHFLAGRRRHCPFVACLKQKPPAGLLFTLKASASTLEWPMARRSGPGRLIPLPAEVASSFYGAHKNKKSALPAGFFVCLLAGRLAFIFLRAKHLSFNSAIPFCVCVDPSCHLRWALVNSGPAKNDTFLCGMHKSKKPASPAGFCLARRESCKFCGGLSL